MFGIIENLAKAAVSAALTPVAVVADVMEIAGVKPGKSHTEKAIDGIIGGISGAIDEAGK